MVSQPVEVSTPPVHLPSVHIPSIPPVIRSTLEAGGSKAQIVTGKFLKTTLPKALSGTGKGILKGLGFGGKAGIKAGLAAAGVGTAGLTTAAAVALTVLDSKKARQAIYYTIIGFCGILFFFLFDTVNKTGSLFSPGSIVESAPLPSGISPTGSGGYTASCPASGIITTHSYDFDKTGGHCSPSYNTDYGVPPASCCGTSGRRAKSIDVSTGGNDVILPQIQGQTTGWTITNKMCAATGATYPNCTGSGEEGGAIYEFTTNIPNSTVSQDIWTLQLTHMQPNSNPQQGNSYPPQTPVGKTVAPGIVHISIGRNVSGDCVGWIPADFMCQ